MDNLGNVYVGDTDDQEVRLISGNAAGLVSGDTAAFTESFNTKNVGTGLTLTPAGSVNDGNGGSNYTVTFVANSTGQITARAITVTAITGTKGYDGTASSAATPTITAGNLASGDTVTLSESFGSKNAGTGLILTPAATISDGNGGANYSVTLAANAAGSITARAITVTATTGTKGYDGTTSSAATPTISSGAWPRATRQPSRRSTTRRTSARARRSAWPAPSTTATAATTMW